MILAATVLAAALATATPSPEPIAPPVSNDISADQSLISPIRTFSVQGTYTGIAYGSGNSGRAVQIVPRLAAFYIGKSLLRLTMPRFQTLNRVDSGFGDTQLFYLVQGSFAGGRTYVGGFAQLPTGSPSTFSQKKWLLGPAAAYIASYKPRVRTIALLLQTAFSIAGPRTAPNQSAISFLPAGSWQLGHRWFFKTPESPWLFDLQRGSTLIALGGGFGRNGTIDGVPYLIAITDEGTAVHANVRNAPRNTLRLSLTLILPNR